MRLPSTATPSDDQPIINPVLERRGSTAATGTEAACRRNRGSRRSLDSREEAEEDAEEDRRPLNRLKVGEKVLGARVTLRPVLGQQLSNNRIERFRHRRIDAAHRRRISHQQCGEDLGRAAPSKSRLPGRHLIQNAAQAKEVRTRIERVALGLLRRHIRSGSNRRPRNRKVRGARRSPSPHHPVGQSSASRATLRAPVSSPGRNRGSSAACAHGRYPPQTGSPA